MKAKKPEKSQIGDFDKNKFALQLTMPGKRRVFMSKVNTMGGYLAKIKQGINNDKSQFIFDKRTNSVRLFSDRSMALSNQLGKGSKRDYNAVFRKFKDTRD